VIFNSKTLFIIMLVLELNLQVAAINVREEVVEEGVFTEGLVTSKRSCNKGNFQPTIRYFVINDYIG